ncbi:hypothetical protein CKO31_05290 [Thiohalocapsa halophila]|uniref:Aerotolerance regulator N-terminal domain-containing protein n=1 Tax=Thiohalocapsa halophila TaxID=69359 RepID=A0ABS1CE54_9GAMM|nr:hypothetical protein [Thiohalocapsa halophila]MBK1630165.1 hypothetical protein [Thiohalocapsa halophila]
MITFAAPWWLLGLGLLPLLRPLHRRGQASPALVPALFPWITTQAPEAAALQDARPDPRWRRRALIAALLLLALAGIGWRPPADSLQVRVELEATPSLLAVEPDGRSRAAHAAVALHTALANAHAPSATLFASGADRAPSPVDGLDSAALAARFTRAADAAVAGTASPALPPPLPHGVRTWLVTDGTRGSDAAPGDYSRIITFGESTENFGIAALALRLDPRDASLLQGTVQIHNAGTHHGERALVLTQGQRTLAEWRVSVAASATEVRHFDIPRAGGARLLARLKPADALAVDDQLEVAAEALQPLAAQIAPECPDTLRAAVAASPRLESSEAAPALMIVCAERPSPEASSSAVSLWFRAASAQSLQPLPRALLPAPLQGLDSATRPRTVAIVPAEDHAGVLLAGTRRLPLVLGYPGERRIDVLIELPRGTGGAPALLLDWLLDRLPAALPQQPSPVRGAIGPVAARRATAQMRIAPGPVAQSGTTGRERPPSRTVPAALALAVALALLVPELTRTGVRGPSRSI